MVPYLLIHRRGLPGSHTFQGNQFDTVDDALDEARERNAAGDKGNFLIETGLSRIVMNDAEIAA